MSGTFSRWCSGADPDVRNKAGESARTAIEAKGPTSEAAEALGELMTLYDAAGSMAFEDPPGTWRQFAEGSRTYYQNTENQESRWAVPPSCGWKRQVKQAGKSSHSRDEMQTHHSLSLPVNPPLLKACRQTR